MHARGLAERRLLHVAVARTVDAAGRQPPSASGRSNRCRATTCRPTDRACRESVRRPRHNRARSRRSAPDAAAARSRHWRHRERSSTRAIASLAPNGSASIGGALMFGAGNTKVRSTRDLVRRLGAGPHQRIGRQPADIAVRFKLAPAPAFLVDVVDRDALALQRFGVERRVGHGSRRSGAIGSITSHSFAFDEALGRDLAFEIFRREIGTRRRQAGIERHAASSVAFAEIGIEPRARPGIRRLPAGRASPTAFQP